LAQCRFPGLAIFNAKTLTYFQVKCTSEAIFFKQHSETVNPSLEMSPFSRTYNDFGHDDSTLNIVVAIIIITVIIFTPASTDPRQCKSAAAAVRSLAVIAASTCSVSFGN